MEAFLPLEKKRGPRREGSPTPRSRRGSARTARRSGACPLRSARRSPSLDGPLPLERRLDPALLPHRGQVIVEVRQPDLGEVASLALDVRLQLVAVERSQPEEEAQDIKQKLVDSFIVSTDYIALRAAVNSLASSARLRVTLSANEQYFLQVREPRRGDRAKPQPPSGLRDFRVAREQEGALEAIESIGFLQIDTISVVREGSPPYPLEPRTGLRARHDRHARERSPPHPRILGARRVLRPDARLSLLPAADAAHQGARP